MAGMRLIQRHEQFLREYILNGWCGQAAYRKVYGPVPSAKVQASKLLARPHIRKRYNQMMKKILNRAEITEERILGKYEEAFNMAEAQGKPSDMISAASAQAKLVGLLRDRIEAGAPGEFNHLENISDVLEALSQQVSPEVAAKIGEALGIIPAIEHKQDESAEVLAATDPASRAIN